MKRIIPYSSDSNAHPSYPTKTMKELFAAIMKLRNEKEASMFFRDLLTIAELREFANRWKAVLLLKKGTAYINIAKKLGISTATVTRVAHWLKNGMGGYRIISDRILKRHNLKK